MATSTYPTSINTHSVVVGYLCWIFATNRPELSEQVRKQFEQTANWWHQFAVHEVSSVEAVDATIVFRCGLAIQFAIEGSEAQLGGESMASRLTLVNLLEQSRPAGTLAYQDARWLARFQVWNRICVWWARTPLDRRIAAKMA